jgi:hypothetical protein
MTWAHDHPMAGHPGHDETIYWVKQHRQWQGMNAWITDYVKGCATCQQNKIIMHRACTPTYCIPTGNHTLPFQQVAIDLITGLPTCNGKDAILTIVDHGCSRAAIFLPCMLCTEDPLELHLNIIKANTEALIQSIHCVISYASCLIVSMPYGLSSLWWLVGPTPQGGSSSSDSIIYSLIDRLSDSPLWCPIL